jgi:putative phosphoribosyl transferase
MGAIASGGIRILNTEIVDGMGPSRTVIDQVTERELAELQRRERQYRGDCPAVEVRDRTVIQIYDGLTTGASMLAAVRCICILHALQLLCPLPQSRQFICSNRK